MSGPLGSVYERLVGGALYPLYESRLRGRGTFRYLAEAEASQWLSPDEVRELQMLKLRALLTHAHATVPYYRDLFDSHGLKPDRVTRAADLAVLPPLTKAAVREQGDRLLSRAFRPGSLIVSATGGSTGEPMRFFYNRDSYERRTATAMRGDRWAGWRLCGPEFYLWGAQLLPTSGLLRLKKQIHHAALRRVVVSSFNLTTETVLQAVHQYRRQRPSVVIGYANALYEFSRFVIAEGLHLPSPEGVVSSAEKLYGYQRETIEEAFGAPVFNRYGCREVMMVSAECEAHDGLHVASDNVLMEVVKSGQLCEPGELGEVYLTDLHNYGMPLIRYQVGDLAAWHGKDCPCGRGLPLMRVVEGRTLGLISTPSGRVVSGEFFPHLLKDFNFIRAYQVVQERPDHVTIRASLAGEPPTQQVRRLQGIVQEALGSDMDVTWEMGPQVVIEQGRKFKPVISHVPVNLGSRGTERS
ncbi:MAG TPA: phenylacetate--CoA ligase family protein [Armatimonadota bacterium]|jgi:phenylacetate-CoA ligase